MKTLYTLFVLIFLCVIAQGQNLIENLKLDSSANGNGYSFTNLSGVTTSNLIIKAIGVNGYVWSLTNSATGEGAWVSGGGMGANTNGYTSIVFSNASSFYPTASNPSNYVTAAITNGLGGGGSTNIFTGAGTTGLITANASQVFGFLRGDGRWVDRVMVFQDEFASKTIPLWWNNVSSGAGSTPVHNSSDTNAPNVYSFMTGTTDTGRSQWRGNAADFNFQSNSSVIVTDYKVRIDFLPTAGSNHIQYGGYVDASGFNSAVDSIAIYAPAHPETNWFALTRAGSVSTVTTSTVQVALGWHTNTIIITNNATHVYFYVNGTLIATHTNNIPGQSSSGQATTPSIGIESSTGVQSRTMQVDYFRVWEVREK